MTAQRRRRAALIAGLPLLLAACTGGRSAAEPPATAAASVSPAPRPSPAASSPQSPPSPSFAPSPALSPNGSTEPPFRADTSKDAREDEPGPDSTVVDIRVGRQPGYDRVVFDLDQAGPGSRPGWRVGYVDDARQAGSGNAVGVTGSAVLEVVITGTGYPFDTGVEDFDGPTSLPSGLASVRDVVYQSVFEGQTQAFVGLEQRRPFRVFLLENPTRVVLDVRDR